MTFLFLVVKEGWKMAGYRVVWNPTEERDYRVRPREEVGQCLRCEEISNGIFILPCGHLFCGNCLYWQSNVAYLSELTHKLCPECGQLAVVNQRINRQLEQACCQKSPCLAFTGYLILFFVVLLSFFGAGWLLVN